MSKSEKRTFITASAAIIIYLVLTLFFLGQTGCAAFQNPPAVNPFALLGCAQTAQKCIADIQEAKESGDAEQLVLATAQCSQDWINQGCAKLVEDMVKQSKEAK